MEITAQMVKELRDRTQAGVLDCKKALQEADTRCLPQFFLPLLKNEQFRFLAV